MVDAKKELNMNQDEASENEESIWSENTFIETLSSSDVDTKMRTFHMKHNEEMNYNCKKCNIKISAHNRDWHNHLCDKCFDTMFDSENDEQSSP